MEFNLGTLIATNVASLIVGMALTAMTLYINFSHKLGIFETKMDIMTKQLDEHTKAPTIICGYHTKFEDELYALKTQSAINKENIDKITSH